jgi:hypothetical protein
VVVQVQAAQTVVLVGLAVVVQVQVLQAARQHLGRVMLAVVAVVKMPQVAAVVLGR